MQRSAAAVSKFKIIFAWPSISVACTIREIRIARAYRDHGTGNEKIAVLVAEGYCALIGYGSSAAAASIFLERGRGGGGGTEVPRRQLGPVPPSSCFPPRLANTLELALSRLASTIAPFINRKSSNYLQNTNWPGPFDPSQNSGDTTTRSRCLTIINFPKNRRENYEKRIEREFIEVAY